MLPLESSIRRQGSGFAPGNSSGSASVMKSTSFWTELLLKGGWPDAISYRTQPKAQRSDAMEGGASFLSSSGAVYMRLPFTTLRSHKSALSKDRQGPSPGNDSSEIQVQYIQHAKLAICRALIVRTLYAMETHLGKSQCAQVAEGIMSLRA